MNDPGDQGVPSVPKFILRVPPKKTEVRRVVQVAKPIGGEELLVDGGGVPVWPVRDGQDGKALTSICEVLGGSMEDARAPASRSKVVPTGDELVLGIGDVEQEARLYAHLSGRSYELVPRIEDAPDLGQVSVFLCMSPSIDPTLIETVSLLPYQGQAPGIIWGRTRDELRRRILVSSCAAALSTPAAVRAVDVIGPRIGALQATPTEIGRLKEDLASGPGVLTLYAHSDGVAQDLPARSALCARADPSTVGDMQRAPECVYTGDCFRTQTSVAEAMEAGLLISPKAIAARIVVDIACQAAFVGNQALAPEWSVFALLLANPRIGALLAPAHTFQLRGVVWEELLTRLKEGYPVGNALARYDGSSAMSTLDGRFLLFGDPRLRATSESAAPRLTSEPSSIRKTSSSMAAEAPADSIVAAQLDLFRAAAKLAPQETRRECESNSRRMLDLLRDIGQEESSWGEGVATELRSAFLEHMGLTKSRISSAWESEVIASRNGKVMACPHCGLRAPAVLVQLHSGMTREVFKCIACTEVFDHQVGCSRLPRVQLPLITLEGAGTDAAWAGSVFVVRKKPTDTVAFPWPEEEGGAPAKCFSIVNELARGPIRICAVYIDGFAVHTATLVTTGDSVNAKATAAASPLPAS
jgi:hypothetical protein